MGNSVEWVMGKGQWAMDNGKWAKGVAGNRQMVIGGMGIGGATYFFLLRRMGTG